MDHLPANRTPSTPPQSSTLVEVQPRAIFSVESGIARRACCEVARGMSPTHVSSPAATPGGLVFIRGTL
jgi:hypothetical protein